MAAHDLHHGGEIGCLRDLYRAQLLLRVERGNGMTWARSFVYVNM